MQNIEYVIYCRKSTDESSDNQKQSIPDQIKACVDYAEREGLEIMEKPKDFSLFESEQEVFKEENESDLRNRRIFQSTRNLYIIKEQETGKTPGKRVKWNNLIKKIKKGEIKGLISYSPDRQARNMLEGGELINCVDEGLIDLKYTNFHFENNASGKMMLGIWFVFSKQYSDKLSEDISRGINSKVTSGKAIGNFKPGYFINKEGFHEPHPEHFPLIKEAFKMKLNGEIESDIRDFLNANGYRRKMKKSGAEKEMGRNALNKMFRDEFYYGMFISGDNIVDLTEYNTYFKPIITQEQYEILQDRYYRNPVVISKTKTKDIYEDIKVFDVDFILTDDDFGLTFSLPNKKRFEEKIKNANIKGERLELKDVVKPHQIRYRCATKNSKHYGLEVTLADIDNAILKALEYFKVGEKQFKEYINFTNKQLENLTKTTKEKVASKTLEIGRLKAKKENYIKNNLPNIRDEEEREIYEKTKLEFNKKVRFLRKEIMALDEGERNEIVELEVFIDVLNNAKSYYKRANFVQKKKIAKILFLNIKINAKKELAVQVKPELQTLFNPQWWVI
ncbi:MAG: recombinase family protein [Candidatus Gracilibacteria bacterium]|nr:recombinase family protein [Candidatus Gracilibacteria bacterium]